METLRPFLRHSGATFERLPSLLQAAVWERRIRLHRPLGRYFDSRIVYASKCRRLDMEGIVLQAGCSVMDEGL